MNEDLRAHLETWFTCLRLMPAVRAARAGVLATLPSERRLAHRHRERFEAFRRSYSDVVRSPTCSPSNPRGIALMMAGGFPPCIPIEIALIKGLQQAGYEVRVVVFGGTAKFVVPYYRLAGVDQFYDWKAFKPPSDIKGAADILEQCRTVDDLVAREDEGFRIGQFAVSSAIRHTRRGSMNPRNPDDRRALVLHLAQARQAAGAAAKLLRTVHPALGVFVDTEYTPTAELFDACLLGGVEVLQYDIAHKSNALMLHRYTLENRHQHPWSLSDASWERVRAMPWSEHHGQRVADELAQTYASGDWFSACGTQFGKRLLSPDQLRHQLGLDLSKKTAVIFSHVLWDAPVVWGTRLFRDYEEWLVETVRAACANSRLNWLIKVHPANIGKSLKEGFTGEAAEVTAIREHVGPLPAHVQLLPAATPISTLSLFSVTDYCLTVRGTPGMEAARLGIPVLNAGGGRYDGRGFTMDPKTRGEYLDLVGRLDTIPPLGPEAQELATRFLYAYLILRPLQLTSVTFRFSSGSRSDGQAAIDAGAAINLRHPSEWATSPDLIAFVDWVTNGPRPDFLVSPDSAEPVAIHG